MVAFCDLGQRAKVTFPDGSIQQFTDTPISITSELATSDCQQATLKFTRTYSNGWTMFYDQPVSARIYLPYGGLIHGSRNASILCKGRVGIDPSCGNYQYYVYGKIGSGTYYGVKFVSLIPDSPLYQITITGNSGNLLFQQTYSSEDYLVECVAGCPINSLDCGDCCLDCDTILNGITLARLDIFRIK